MSLPLPLLLWDHLPHICLLISTLLTLYLTHVCARRGRLQSGPNYAFSASTKIQQRPPTVLQFSARVPLGRPAVPLVLRSLDDVSDHEGQYP